MIDGSGYFITHSEKTFYACPRTGSGDSIPRFACMLPKILQNDVVLEERNYYLLTPHGADLRPIGNSGYVTDGRTVFLHTEIVKNADPKTFQPLDTKGGDFDPTWARDKNHIYYEETIVPDLVLGDVDFAGPFIINYNRVFQFDSISGVHIRPDVRPNLTLLSPRSVYYASVVSDGEQIYLNGKPMEGINAYDFRMLSPSCPVPGHPELSCRIDSDLSNEGSQRYHFARVGNDILNIRPFNEVKRIPNVPNFIYFQPAGSSRVFGINGQQLYEVDNFKYSNEPTPFYGRISGPIAGALIDQSGFITPFPWSKFTLCNRSPWPQRDDLKRFGTLRRLPDGELPEGFKVALENQRYRYLFVSLDERSAEDTIIDLQSGISKKADCT